jgi:hypothetical protein
MSLSSMLSSLLRRSEQYAGAGSARAALISPAPGSYDLNAAWVWLLRSEYAGEASCATDVTCRSGVPRRAGWRQPGDRNDVTSWRS